MRLRIHPHIVEGKLIHHNHLYKFVYMPELNHQGSLLQHLFSSPVAFELKEDRQPVPQQEESTEASL